MPKDEVINIVRSKKPFFIIDNKLIEDEKISCNAKWVMICINYLQEKHDGDIHFFGDSKALARTCGLSSALIEASLKELIRDEYLLQE